MTLAGAIAVPDGIAIVADSLTSWHRRLDDDAGTRVPDGGSAGTTKVRPLPSGGAVATAGQARIEHVPTSRFAAGTPLDGVPAGAATRDAIVDHLREGLRRDHGVDDLSDAPAGSVSLLYAVHPEGRLDAPYVSRVKIRLGPDAAVTRHDNAESRYCSHWIGSTGLVSRLLERHEDVPRLGGNYLRMSLPHAVELATFMIRTTAEAQRLGRGVPDVAGPLHGATLSPQWTALTLN